MAQKYAEDHGMIYREPVNYVPPDKDRGARIAKAFEEMKHDPNDPHVKAAYDALINETMAQWHAVQGAGIKAEAIPKGMPDPYGGNSNKLIDDVRAGHIWYFPTTHGFGSDAQFNDNPLMRPTEEKDSNGRPMLANDVFRVVHDIFGHVKEGNSFGPGGEDNAWQSHVKMFSPLAAEAMTTETRGQNSWVNFGPHGAGNQADKSNTKYADQKAGLMPAWTWEEATARVIYPQRSKNA